VVVSDDIQPHTILTEIYFETSLPSLHPHPPQSPPNRIRGKTLPSLAHPHLRLLTSPETTQIVICISRPQISLTQQSTHKSSNSGTPDTPPTGAATSLAAARPPHIPRKLPIMFGRDLKKTGSLTLVGTPLSRVKHVASGSVGAAKRRKLMSG
jgi:hypothetical protein